MNMTKTRTKMNKVLLILAAAAMVLSLAACGGKGASKADHDRSTPSGTAALMLDVLKTMDVGLMQEYAAGDDSFIENLNDPTMQQALSIMKNITKNMTYEIKGETIDGDKAVVEVAITTFDSNELIEDMQEKLMTEMLKGTLTTEADIEKFAMDYFDKLDTSKFAKQTTDTTVDLVKSEEGNWMVDASDELMNAVMGNLGDAIGMW